MRRRSGTAPLSGTAPAELLDPHSAVWSDPKHAAQWMEDHHLQSSVSRMRELPGPLNRHHHAAQQWAHAQGMTRTFAGGGVGVDWHQTRAAGIPPAGGARIIERLEHAGVTITPD